MPILRADQDTKKESTLLSGVAIKSFFEIKNILFINRIQFGTKYQITG